MGVHRTERASGFAGLAGLTGNCLLKTRHNPSHMGSLLGRQALKPLLQ